MVVYLINYPTKTTAMVMLFATATATEFGEWAHPLCREWEASKEGVDWEQSWVFEKFRWKSQRREVMLLEVML